MVILKKHVIIFVCALVFLAFQFVQINVLAPFTKILLIDYHFTAFEIGILSASYFLANFIFLLPAGIVLDFFPLKTVFKFVLILMFIGVSCYSFYFSFITILIGRFFVGIAGAFSFILCMKIACAYFDSCFLVRLTGFTYAAAMIGSILGQIPFSYLIQAMNFESIMIFNFIICLAMVVSFIIILSQIRHEHMINVKHKIFPGNYLKRITIILSRKQNWIGIIYTSFLNMPLFILGDLWGDMYISTTYKLSMQTATWIVSLIFLGVIFSSLCMGCFSERVCSKKKVMAGGATITFILLLCFFLPVHSIIFACFLCFFIGFFSTTQLLGYSHVIANNDVTLSGAGSGLVSLFAMITVTLMQPFYSWLVKYDHGLLSFKRSLFLVLALVGFSFLVSIFSKETADL